MVYEIDDFNNKPPKEKLPYNIERQLAVVGQPHKTPCRLYIAIPYFKAHYYIRTKYECIVTELVAKARWLHGPQFLWQSREQWPEQPRLENLISDPEIKAKSDESCLVTSQGGKSIIDRLLESRSDWYSLKKDVAWIYLRHKILNQVIPELGQPLSVQELEAAEVAIVKYIQQGMKGVTFSASGFNVEKSSAVNKLDPYVSRHGILCVGGPLHNAQPDNRSKHPYILPKEAYVCSLIVKDIHVHSGHADRTTLATLQLHPGGTLAASIKIKGVTVMASVIIRLCADLELFKKAEMKAREILQHEFILVIEISLLVTYIRREAASERNFDIKFETKMLLIWALLAIPSSITDLLS
ncbi:hypothetical protein HOLleu_08035 [Holothuria leucospilota]|uniref:Uncharacterized protein n=1 Tax=Holothuria leucospilota TaxID=206669 RepID=A0A9Q1HHI3_HOLLE|nr:hypothetical protein HOLleu_08035 [Holothuria leucospilota]